VGLLILLGRPHVDERDRPGLEAARQLLPIDGLELVTSGQVVLRDRVQFREPLLGRPAKREPERLDRRIGQPVQDPLAVAARLDEAGRGQDLKVLRRIGDRQLGAAGQRVDRALALDEEVEQL
jgi:hypothetical protein